MTTHLRRPTIFAILAGFLLAIVLSLINPTSANASGVGSGGSGSGGSGGEGGCAAFNTKWQFTHGKVPPVGSGCINNTLTGSSCHTSANIGSWVFYVTATSGSNAGKHISLPTSGSGFAYMKNKLTDLIQSTSNISAGFTTYGASQGANTAANRTQMMRYIETQISDGKYGVGGSAKWQERGGSNYRASNGKTLTYVCAWLDCTATACNVPGIHLTPPSCSGYGVTSAKYIIRKGVNVTTTKASSSADALAKCVLHCPTSSSPDPNGVKRYLQRAGVAIGSTYNTAAKQGAYCYKRASTSTTQTRTQTKVTGTTTTSAANAGTWSTIAEGDDGALQRTHPGPTKFVYQDTDVNSSWGQLLQSLNGGCPTPAQMSAAAAKIPTDGHASVKLSATNQQALAEGGILDVREMTVYMTVASSKTVHQPQVSTRVITTTYSFTLANTGAEYGVGNGTSKTSTGAWGAWKNTGTATSTCAGKVLPQTPKETSFFQAYANHCDAADYTARVSGNTAIATGDSLHSFSAAFVTPRVENGSLQTLGYGRGDRAGQFDKLCSYDGVRDSTGSATAVSARAASDGTVATGATAGPANVSFFRDNAQHAYTVDHYVPMSENVVTYKGTDALATMVSLWNGGTPKAPGVTNKGQFQITLGGYGIFSASSAPAPTLTDWSNYNGTDFSSRTLGIEGGDHKTLNVAADWPSDQGKPAVFTVKWVYAPQVSNKVPTTVGFTPTEARSYTLGTVSTAIQGEVYGKQGAASATSGALPTEVAGATGSAPTALRAAPVNSLDGVLHFGTSLDAKGAWIPRPDAYSPFYHVVNFLRAVGA